MTNLPPTCPNCARELVRVLRPSHAPPQLMCQGCGYVTVHWQAGYTSGESAALVEAINTHPRAATDGGKDGMVQAENEALLMRVTLGLNPAHSLLAAVNVLFSDGREAFEKMRGPVCEYAHEWKPIAAAPPAQGGEKA